MKAVVQGIGIIAPGLVGWESARAVLRREQPWQSAPLDALKPALLPPNERRRTTQLIKLALQAAEEAQQQSGHRADELACVFASAEGDSFIVDKLCDALSLPDHPVSPTQFHNSVHNAAAGYWAIAGGAQRYSTSISAGSASFAAGLQEALSWIETEGESVLLVVYDVAMPPALDDFGICHEPFSVALVLAPPQSKGIAQLHLGEIIEQGEPTALSSGLDALREKNPAAESLALLEALATAQKRRVVLRYFDGDNLQLDVTPC